MAELKTQETDGDVLAFLNSVESRRRREDGLRLLELMQAWTGRPPRLWGDSLVGFGAYHYVYKSGHGGRWPLTGFSPRKTALTVYIMPGFSAYGDLMKRIGKVRHSSSCLYIPRLDRIELHVLSDLVTRSVEDMRSRYGEDG